MDLKVQKRDQLGSKIASLRKEGFIPAELYGHGIPNVHLAVPAKEFRSVYKTAGENQVVNLWVDDSAHPVLIYEVNVHPLTDEVQSIDFYQVKMDEEISTSVPLKFIGESPAVKNLGGVLVKTMDEIKIKALPANIPAEITIDLAVLAELHQSVYVKDLPHTDKFKFMVDPTTVIVTVSEQREEEVAPVVAPDLEAVKVEGEEKKAVRDAEKAATSETPAK